jgi:hypothetical protein
MAENEPNLRTSSYTAAVAQSIGGSADGVSPEKQPVSDMTCINADVAWTSRES